jgi:hypothetical protein
VTEEVEEEVVVLPGEEGEDGEVLGEGAEATDEAEGDQEEGVTGEDVDELLRDQEEEEAMSIFQRAVKFARDRTKITVGILAVLGIVGYFAYRNFMARGPRE